MEAPRIVMSNLVKVRLHGDLSKDIGYEWELSVNSVAEALKAIDNLCGRKLFKKLLDNDKKNILYEVIVDKKKIDFDDSLSDKSKITQQKVSESELCIQRPFKTLDIVPVFQGAKKFFKKVTAIITAVVGVALIVAGFIVGGPLGVALVLGGLGLVAAGVSYLLAKPPEPEGPRDIELKGPNSYIFQNLENVNKEGNPVPVGYGRLRVGSYVIQTSFDNSNALAVHNPSTTSQLSSLATTKTVITAASDTVFT